MAISPSCSDVLGHDASSRVQGGVYPGWRGRTQYIGSPRTSIGGSRASIGGSTGPVQWSQNINNISLESDSAKDAFFRKKNKNQ